MPREAAGRAQAPCKRTHDRDINLPPLLSLPPPVEAASAGSGRSQAAELPTLGAGAHQLFAAYAPAARPNTTATSRARNAMDRHVSLTKQCAGMAALMSASVNGGGAARPLPVCRQARSAQAHARTASA